MQNVAKHSIVALLVLAATQIKAIDYQKDSSIQQLQHEIDPISVAVVSAENENTTNSGDENNEAEVEETEEGSQESDSRNQTSASGSRQDTRDAKKNGNGTFAINGIDYQSQRGRKNCWGRRRGYPPPPPPPPDDGGGADAASMSSPMMNMMNRMWNRRGGLVGNEEAMRRVKRQTDDSVGDDSGRDRRGWRSRELEDTKADHVDETSRGNRRSRSLDDTTDSPVGEKHVTGNFIPKGTKTPEENPENEGSDSSTTPMPDSPQDGAMGQLDSAEARGRRRGRPRNGGRRRGGQPSEDGGDGSDQPSNTGRRRRRRRDPPNTEGSDGSDNRGQGRGRRRGRFPNSGQNSEGSAEGGSSNDDTGARGPPLGRGRPDFGRPGMGRPSGSGEGPQMGRPGRGRPSGSGEGPQMGRPGMGMPSGPGEGPQMGIPGMGMPSGSGGGPQMGRPGMGMPSGPGEWPQMGRPGMGMPRGPGGPQMGRPGMGMPSGPGEVPQMGRPGMGMPSGPGEVPQMGRPGMGMPSGSGEWPQMGRPGVGMPSGSGVGPQMGRPGMGMPSGPGERPQLGRPGMGMPSGSGEGPNMGSPGMEMPGTGGSGAWRPGNPISGGTGTNTPGGPPTGIPGSARPTVGGQGPDMSRPTFGGPSMERPSIGGSFGGSNVERPGIVSPNPAPAPEGPNFQNPAPMPEMTAPSNSTKISPPSSNEGKIAGLINSKLTLRDAMENEIFDDIGGKTEVTKLGGSNVIIADSNIMSPVKFVVSLTDSPRVRKTRQVIISSQSSSTTSSDSPGESRTVRTYAVATPYGNRSRTTIVDQQVTGSDGQVSTRVTTINRRVRECEPGVNCRVPTARRRAMTRTLSRGALRKEDVMLSERLLSESEQVDANNTHRQRRNVDSGAAMAGIEIGKMGVQTGQIATQGAIEVAKLIVQTIRELAGPNPTTGSVPSLVSDVTYEKEESNTNQEEPASMQTLTETRQEKFDESGSEIQETTEDAPSDNFLTTSLSTAFKDESSRKKRDVSDVANDIRQRISDSLEETSKRMDQRFANMRWYQAASNVSAVILQEGVKLALGRRKRETNATKDPLSSELSDAEDPTPTETTTAANNMTTPTSTMAPITTPAQAQATTQSPPSMQTNTSSTTTQKPKRGIQAMLAKMYNFNDNMRKNNQSRDEQEEADVKRNKRSLIKDSDDGSTKELWEGATWRPDDAKRVVGLQFAEGWKSESRLARIRNSEFNSEDKTLKMREAMLSNNDDPTAGSTSVVQTSPLTASTTPMDFQTTTPDLTVGYHGAPDYDEHQPDEAIFLEESSQEVQDISTTQSDD